MEELSVEEADASQVDGSSSTSSKEVEENDEWIDIIGSGGLRKKVLKPGICESRPSKGDTVRIDAIGYLEDGTKVEEMKDFIFTVDGGELISGIDLIVRLMDKGETSKVFMETRFAYGEKGLKPNIPSNADLYYDITLIDFKPEDDPEELDIHSRKEIGIRKREIGNWWFNRDDFDPAIKCYKAALDFLDDTSDTYGVSLKPELRDLLEERLITLNNMAAAQIRVEAYDAALISLDNVLKCQPGNIKALYRKGKVLGLQGKAAEGLEHLKKALTLDPNSKIIIQEAAKLQKKAKADAEKEKTLYRRMLGIQSGQTIAAEHNRYQTLRGVSVKLWATIFIILISSLLCIQYLASKFDSSWW